MTGPTIPDPPPTRRALLVIGEYGINRAYSDDAADEAHSHAKAIRALLIEAPIVADYREVPDRG